MSTFDHLVCRAALPRVLAALGRWHTGRLRLELPDGAVHEFGPAADLPVTLRLKSPAAVRRLVLAGDVGFGEAYMDGEWETPDLAALLAQVARNEDALALDGRANRLFGLGNDLLHRLRRNTRDGSRRNVAAHYDLSNEFFGLFLDRETMTYSSALFESADQPLAAAQRDKYRAIAARARLGAGDHVLEIGCGWGGFALHAAREHGCRVTGLTLSREQLAFARARVAAAGLSDRIELRLQDYRDVTGCFDKVVSIEMFEALGREHWPAYFRKIEEVLAPQGIAVLQAISIPDHRFEAYARHCDFIQKHIFPGGQLASLHHATGAMMRASLLSVHQLDDFAGHYALTLARWREAFLRRRDEARALGFDERFLRAWDFYLAACQAWFETRRLGLLQLVLSRPGNTALGAVPSAARFTPPQRAGGPGGAAQHPPEEEAA
jgi:cyclopropane-fatty-acyl-phospholipid synthase